MDPINFRIPKFTVLVDTNVLYRAYLRDIILRLALKDTFKIHWSEDIMQELEESLKKNAGVDDKHFSYIRERMSAAFPDALIPGDGEVVPKITLPDSKDVHIVAAAIRGRCDLIVTSNTKDFPSEVLALFGIEVQHPDEFLNHHLSLEKVVTLETVKEHIQALQNPSLTFDEYLGCLVNAGLVIFPSQLKEAESLVK